MKKFAILISTTISLQAFAADYQTNKEETVRLSKQEIIKNNAQIENEVKKSIEDIVSPVSKYEIHQINYMSNTNAQVTIGLRKQMKKNRKENPVIINFSKEKGSWLIDETTI